MAHERSSLGLVIALSLACAGPARVGRPLGVDRGTLVLDAPDGAALTLVGEGGACEPTATGRRPAGLRVEAACAPLLALSESDPEARLAPLRFEPLPSGRGQVGTAAPWTVRLEYGPADDGCLGLPGHAQVKLGAQPVLRQNTWLRADAIHLLTTRWRAWLVLTNARQGEAISLDGAAETLSWTYPSGASAPDGCAPVDSPSP